MAATVELAYELIEGATDTNGNRTFAKLPYLVKGAADEDEALAAALSESTSTYAGIHREEISVRERRGVDVWLVDVTYQGNTNEIALSFDSTGGTQHIDIARQHLGHFPGSGGSLPEAPDCQGVIGVEGSTPGAPVAGVDIVSSVYQFAETHYQSNSVVTPAFRKAIARKTGMYNNNAFRGYDPCEVLFLGAAGRRMGRNKSDLWEIEYRFAVSQNRLAFYVGGTPANNYTDGIFVPRKRGWEYMWVMYADQLDGTTKRLVKKPVGVYIEKVYLGTDFGSFGIGTGPL